MTTEGTPQGGTISPLLLNVALDGMEKLLSAYTTVRVHQPLPNAKQQKRPTRRNRLLTDSSATVTTS